MFWLSTSTVARLRDQLRAAGQRGMISVDAVSVGAEPGASNPDAVAAELGPLLEAMYLMMSADGEITTEEREVLAGAMHNLSGGDVDGDLVDEMLETARAHADSHGRDSRLRQVIADLAQDESRAEVAFVLAAAIAFADDTIADEENETLDTIAEGLGIDEARADELLDAVEKDMSAAQE
jgi:tellurite resistance protein